MMVFANVAEYLNYERLFNLIAYDDNSRTTPVKSSGSRLDTKRKSVLEIKAFI